MTQVRASDLEWVEPVWFVIVESVERYREGVFSVDKSTSKFELRYQGTYPFHRGQDLSYSELLVQFQGRGYVGENTENYHEYYITTQNPDQGSTGETTVTFQPDCDGTKFNLPAAVCRIPAAGEFPARWE